VAAENPHVAFVVASAAGGVPTMSDMEVYSVSNYLRVREMEEPDRQLAERYARAIVATAFDGAPRAELEAVYQEVRDPPWGFPPPPESNAYWAFSRRIASYDALSYWRRVDVPTLFVHGEADERTAPRESASRIAEAYLDSQGPRLDVELFPGADHNFACRRAAAIGSNGRRPYRATRIE
jgi:pimeloyl-ACP methyl ester carboxylesterase